MSLGDRTLAFNFYLPSFSRKCKRKEKRKSMKPEIINDSKIGNLALSFSFYPERIANIIFEQK